MKKEIIWTIRTNIDKERKTERKYIFLTHWQYSKQLREDMNPACDQTEWRNKKEKKKSWLGFKRQLRSDMKTSWNAVFTPCQDAMIIKCSNPGTFPLPPCSPSPLNAVDLACDWRDSSKTSRMRISLVNKRTSGTSEDTSECRQLNHSSTHQFLVSDPKYPNEGNNFKKFVG